MSGATEPDFSGGRAGRDAAPVAAVIGLGLIGGSVARDLAAGGVRVLAHDADAASLDAALASGAVQARLGPGLEGVTEADWVVLAVPVDIAPGLLAALAPRLGRARLITDVGSTKLAITAAAQALGLGERFVGSHPFAGDHRSGWGASAAGLFRGARVYLTPCPATGDSALRAARELWSLCGAAAEVMDAAAHDRLMAWASHLPQVTATALALALADAGVPRDRLGRGGRDATRLAAGSPDVWTGIALENATPLAAAVKALEARLAAFRRALDQQNAAAAREFFREAAAWAGRGATCPG